MNPRADAERAGHELSNRLAKDLVTGYPESRTYVPRSCFEKQITRATIERCLPDAQDELLDFIWNRAQKLFAILLYSDCLPRDIDLESALQTFKNRHLTDEQLPLPRHKEQCTCMQDQAFCPHKVARETLVKWDLRGWEHFYTDQWKFLAPEFETGKFDYVLDEQSILPIQLRDGHGEGSFGDVREGELNLDHARESERRGESRRVAIKSFKSVYENDTQGLTAHRAFETEAKNVRELSERNHPHIVRRVATVVHGKQFLILSDWANGGDLKSFWEQERRPSVGPGLVSEVVTQLCGLASAIDSMHYGKYMSPLSRSVSQSSTTDTPSTPVVIGVNGEAGRVADIGAAIENSNWRHGDLKPENILRFCKVDELVGTLRISDLGLAKRHVVSTNLRKLPSTSQFGTLGYEPPEAVTMPLSPRSRLYDIWSFGCILLEFVVWILYGYEGLEAFWKLPTESEGFLFWCRLPAGVEPGAKVNPSVTQTMDRILETNAACRQPSAIHDLLLLVRDRVLVPALPGIHSTILPESCRVQANVLLRALQDIKNRCESPEYCCPSQPERDARLPTNALQPISRNVSDTLPLPPTQHGNGMANLQVPSSAVRIQRYHQPLNRDDWVFYPDNKFITNLFNAYPSMRDRPLESTGMNLCQRCSHAIHQFLFDFMTSADKLHKTSVQCDLCRLLLKVIGGRLPNGTITGPLRIRRKASKITVQRGPHNYRLLTVRKISETSQCELPNDIQVGMPSLCKIDDPEYSQLILAWLRDCDTNHTECRKDFGSSGNKARQYPARLIAIEKSLIRLVDTRDIDDGVVEPLKYLALSYTWGDKVVHKRYFTTTDTYEQHCTAIPKQSLPNLFLDALTITQNLGIRYLWIDALCIKQGEGGDWESEAQRMHATFSAAYCVLAASRCTGTNDRILVERPRHLSATFRDHGLAVSEDIDDFQLEVIEGFMNKRGWVLQERALARRTIYFAEKQTYWECGQGIRCETLTKMANKQASFLGDANFPQVAQRDSKGARIRLFQILYQQYSRLGFSVSTDRPVAIAGLETRLINAFDTSGGFGLFERYLGRSLLWTRAPEVARLTKIPFQPAQTNPVPSWSWMAYEEAISFLDPPFGKIDWTVDVEFRPPVEFRSPVHSSDGTTSRTSRGRMSSNRNGHRTELRVVARPFDMVAEAPRASNVLSGIVWDDPTALRDHGQLRCVVIGRLKPESDTPAQTHWVLVIRELSAGLYERVGAGFLSKDRISQGAEEMDSSVC